MNPYLQALRCVYCDAQFPVSAMFTGCPQCRGETFASGLTPDYDYGQLRDDVEDGPLAEPEEGLWRYRRLLPVDRAYEVTLGEGGTPLVPLPSVANELDAEQVWVKDESRNPTWTFKDRNAAVTISKALEFGAETVVVSTSGNHGASIAAYAARARIDCITFTYPGVADTTRTMIESFGAKLIMTAPEERWSAMKRGIRYDGWYPASNYTDIPTGSPYGHEGYKTIAYEIVDTLGDAPDLVSIPNSYGEGLFGVWKGFDELAHLGRTHTKPTMVACEPAGGPLAVAMHSTSSPIARVPRAKTVARGIGGSINSYLSVAALNASDGRVAQATDEEVLAARRTLAAEGLHVEPASAAALAGLRGLYREGHLDPGLRIVLVNTSSGLKYHPTVESPIVDGSARRQEVGT